MTIYLVLHFTLSRLHLQYGQVSVFLEQSGLTFNGGCAKLCD